MKPISTILDFCTEMDECLSQMAREIERIRLNLNNSPSVNKTVKELNSYLDEQFQTLLADILITRETLFEVDQCRGDYMEISYLLELKNETKNTEDGGCYEW